MYIRLHVIVVTRYAYTCRSTLPHRFDINGGGAKVGDLTKDINFMELKPTQSFVDTRFHVPEWVGIHQKDP